MHTIQVLVAEVVICVGYHFVRVTFEAHTRVALGACHVFTSTNSDHCNSTIWIRTPPDTMCLHILFSGIIAGFFGLLLAGAVWMIFLLNRDINTLHLGQKMDRQASHVILSS